MSALVRLLRSCYEVLPDRSDRLAILDRAAARVLGDAERGMERPSDLEQLRRGVVRLQSHLAAKQGLPS